MQEIVVRGITLLLTTFIVTGSMKWIQNWSEIPKEGIVRLPRRLLYIGIIDFAFFGIISLIIIYALKDIWFAFFFFCFSLLGVLIIIVWLNGKITYDEQNISKKDLFGIRRTYSYYEITEIRESKDTRIYFGKHSIFIDEIAVGGREFIDFIKLQYANSHAGIEIPKAKKSRLDPFNGHVDNYAEFIFLNAVMYVFLFGVFTLLVVTTITPISIDKLERIETSFAYYQIDKSELILYSSSSSMTYEISYYDKYMENLTLLFEEFDSKTVFDVYAKKYNVDKGIPYYQVMSLKDQKGNVFLTIEKANTQRWKEGWDVYYILFGIILLWTIFVAVSIYVGRNPEKFSKKIIRLFFKDGYVH